MLTAEKQRAICLSDVVGSLVCFEKPVKDDATENVHARRIDTSLKDVRRKDVTRKCVSGACHMLPACYSTANAQHFGRLCCMCPPTAYFVGKDAC